MSKVLKHTKSVIVAMINICLFCGAGYVLDWISYCFKKTTEAGRKINPR
jgi:hypothetical protein